MENLNVETILVECIGKDVYDALNYIDTFKLPYPKKVSKPILMSKHTSADVEEYLNKMKEYEILNDEYKVKVSEYKNRNNELDDIKIKLIKESVGLDSIPEKYREKLYSKAYEMGHSDGYYEVYLKLNSLVEIFD